MLKLMAARSPKVNMIVNATSGAKPGVSPNMIETIATRNGVENVRDLYAGTYKKRELLFCLPLFTFAF